MDRMSGMLHGTPDPAHAVRLPQPTRQRRASGAAARSGALAGQVALVVGANGRIGGAVARALAEQGADLVLASRDAGRLVQLTEELRSSGATARAIPTDAADDDAMHRLVAEAAEAGMTTAVNNAGTAHRPAPLGDLALDDVDRVLRVTLRGVLVAMRDQLAALPDGGSVVNVVSTAGLAGAPGMGAYAAAKHGVVGLTRTAALDYADRGVRVNAVAPGAIDSGGTADQPPEVKQRIGSFAPLGRLGTPEEVAAAVAWLASPAAAFTTGAILTVDGGKGARGA